jgi:glycosyltransferase involved in cell wall biosynthesis
LTIAVDTRLLLKDRMDGLGLFTEGSFKHIVKKHADVQFLFIFDRAPHTDFIFGNNVKSIVIGPQARHPLLYIIWYGYALKRLLKKIEPDIFIGTNGMIPLKSSTKTLSVIHDLNFEHHPEHLPRLIRKYYCKYFPKFAKQATRIATVSEFSKKDIIASYQIDKDKIDVVYNGPNEQFKPITDLEKIKFQGKYADGKPFFLFVGTLHPRKNLVNLFKAFDAFKSKTKVDFKLLIIGRKMWWTDEIENTFQNLTAKKDIIFTGRLPEKELYKITASAHALTYIPVFEGFGIPLVEAMSCGTPVITSNITSMPEVVGEAGFLVNPFSVKDIAKAMLTISSNENLRIELIEKSKIQVKKFSWQKTGDRLWDSIIKTMDTNEVMIE